MLESIKTALRISSIDFDSEIIELIDAAKIELKISGVNKIDETDPLIMRAIIIYCKANFGYDNPDAKRFSESFDNLRQHLSSSSDYNEVI